MSGPATPATAGGVPLSAVTAALVAALVGFGGTLALILAAAHAVGANPAEASSWVCALCLCVGASSAILSVRHRMPIITAWSTPGAALIAGFGGGMGLRAATGAFLLAGALTLLCAAVKPLAGLVARLPTGVAAGMLAGVLVRFVMTIAEQAVAAPLLVLPLVALFMAARRLFPQAAVIVVLVAGLAGAYGFGLMAPLAAPLAFSALTFTTPSFEAGALLGLGLPLFLVTMASQNLPGFAVLKTYGYAPPTRSILGVTGLASVMGAPFGAHATNLAAITAAICAGPDADPDPATRWRTGPLYGIAYGVLALLGASLVTVFTALPQALIATVAGLALIAPLSGALTAAMSDEKGRFAAVVTFATTASGISALGLGAPVFGLAAGLVVHLVERMGR